VCESMSECARVYACVRLSAFVRACMCVNV